MFVGHTSEATFSHIMAQIYFSTILKSTKQICEPLHIETDHVIYVTNIDPDLPVQPCSLIRAYAVQ